MEFNIWHYTFKQMPVGWSNNKKEGVLGSYSCHRSSQAMRVCFNAAVDAGYYRKKINYNPHGYNLVPAQICRNFPPGFGSREPFIAHDSFTLNPKFLKANYKLGVSYSYIFYDPTPH